MHKLPLWNLVSLQGAPRGRARELYQQIRAAIIEGRVPTGSKLPSTRLLAKEVGVARNTVVEAFEYLRAEDLIVMREGSGAFVQFSTTVSDGVASHQLQDEDADLLTKNTEAARGARVAASLRPSSEKNPLPVERRPLTPGLPALGSFPIDNWVNLYAKTLRREGSALLTYGEPQGYLPFRKAVADYLLAMRGMRVSPNSVIITSGSVSSVALIARLLAEHAASCWVDDPCHPPSRDALLSCGLSLTPCPVDAEGMNFFSASLTDPTPALALVTPAHQYPLGSSLSQSRREGLLKLAHERGFYVVEDDYDHEFRYEGKPGVSLAAMDGLRRTIYVGTFSKLLAPSLRLGFIVSPPELLLPLVQLKSVYDRHPPQCLQATTGRFIEEGYLATHIRNMRVLYAKRRAIALAETDHELPLWFGQDAPAYGLQLALRLPPHVLGRDVEAACHAAGIGARDLRRYRIDQEADSAEGLVVGFADTGDLLIRQSFAALREIVHSMSGKRN